MNKTSLQIKIDNETKEEFKRFCLEKGFVMDDLFNLFVKEVIYKQAIPFEVSKRNYNQKTIDAINEVKQMIKNSDTSF